MQRRALIRASLIGAMAVFLAACGGSKDESSAESSSASGQASSARTVDVEMKDIAYAPTSVDVKAGEKVTFNFRNTGAIAHDAFVGDAAAQEDHEKEMSEKKSSGMDHDKSANKNALTVEPGKTASLPYTFDKAGSVLVGCHQPGHYAAGMKIQVNVT